MNRLWLVKNGVPFHYAMEEAPEAEVIAMGAAFGEWEGSGRFDFDAGRWIKRDG